MKNFNDFFRIFVVAENSAEGYYTYVVSAKNYDIEGSVNFFGRGANLCELGADSSQADIKSAVEKAERYCGEPQKGLAEELAEEVEKARNFLAQKVERFILSAWELGINPLPALRKQGYICDSSNEQYAVISSPEIGELKIDWE